MERIIRVLLLFLLSFSAFGITKVRVGAYHFPPYFYEDSKESKYAGLTRDLVAILNNHQREYKFIVRATSSKRRYKDLEDGRYDVIFFESQEWGWNILGNSIEFVGDFVPDGEVFIANKETHSSQDIFSDIAGKKLAAFLGYHYAFANYNSDEKYLKKRFNILLTHSHARNIKQVVANRVDIAIVTHSYLKLFFKEQPSVEEKILISKKFDQHYNLQFGVRKASGIDSEAFKKILKQVKETKAYTNLLKKYNLFKP